MADQERDEIVGCLRSAQKLGRPVLSAFSERGAVAMHSGYGSWSR